MESLKNDQKCVELLKENIKQRENNAIILSVNSNNNNNQNYIFNIFSMESEDNSSNNNQMTIERFNNPNEEIIHGERDYRENGPVFIIKFYPNKFCSISTLILNLIPGGLGTMLLGINKKSIKYIVGGIFHFLFIAFFAVIGTILLKKKDWFKIEYKKLMPIYFIIISIFFYLISIYIAFFNNFIFINTKRYIKFHKKEIGIFILLLNIIIPGLGTLMIQSIVPNRCIIKMKRTLNGIAQLFMFIILFIYFSGILKSKENLLLFIFLAIAEYLYTLGTSICFLRNIIISEDIENEIEA